MQLFKTLTEDETQSFIRWADDNKLEASVDKIGVYHPIIINHWFELGLIDRKE